jgi:hypothetical protein
VLLLGIDLELVLVDLQWGEQRQPRHLQRSPNGRALVLDGQLAGKTWVTQDRMSPRPRRVSDLCVN